MKPKPTFALPLLAMLAILATQAPATSATPADLVAAERAFAHDAAETGVRASFLKWLSPRAVVFRPGPVNGPKSIAASKATPAVLSWEPAYAALSDAGDLGWTTGPWSWRPERSASHDQAWGEYLTLWRRQPDGRYLAALDIGISHAKPGAPAGDPEYLAPAKPPHGRGPLDRRRSLWKADAEFGHLAKQGGVAVALDRFGAERMILLREGLPRVVGRVAACDTIRGHEQSATLMSLAQFTADSGDLGYTYGSFVRETMAGADSGYYVHVWHRGAAKPWELAVELVQPLPKPMKKK